MNTDKEVVQKMNMIQDKLKHKLIRIKDTNPVIWGYLINLETPEHDPFVECIASLEIHDRELVQISERDEFPQCWNIPCYLDEIKEVILH